MISKIIMNNKLIFLFSLWGILLLSWPAAAIREQTETGVEANLSAPEKAAVDSLVAQYFDRLFSGDMTGLKNISTGELYSQVERLDTNPGYAEFLRKQYLDAEYELVDYRLNSQKKIMVAVKIINRDGVENHFLIHIDRTPGELRSGQQMKIEDTEKQ